jgi:hypothetical protein
VLSESLGARKHAAVGVRPDRAGGSCVNALELAGAPCSSMVAGFHLPLVDASVVKSISS